ncbi:peptidase M50 [Vulcanisaeta moutnovskia 768-28]|uniref:Peptidase M50 n=1 Tax=Vulcanisaeta moutnovskia (strain 768-28) TaxID=985053 RepID=F0QV59_VULM7|nr:site-2 protease family protein [Vulcanisaeta moutnovskia]ADY00791.1 peptidase M50 [Vulcanisaeta moutnovskia 768-28]
MQYLGLIIVIAAWFVIVGIIYLLRLLGVRVPVKVYYGIFIMLKDEELVKEVIAPLGNLLRRVPSWLIIVLTVGLFSVSMFIIVPIPLIIMSINEWGLPSMLYLMFKNIVLMIIAIMHRFSPIETVEKGFTPLAPLIPGVTVSLYTFIYIIVAIGIGILLHELAHGAVSSRYGIRIKSGGAFALLFLAFGGFVEIDEDELRSRSTLIRLAVYSSGVFMNIVLAYLAVALVELALISPQLTQGLLGTTIVYTANSTDAVLRSGYIITAVNNHPIASIYTLISILSSVSSNNVTLTIFNPVNGAVFNEVLSTRNLTMELLGYSALYVGPWGVVVESRSFYNLMFWIYTLNLTLALLNTFPAYPLDGGQFLDALLANVIKNQAFRSKVMIVISVVLWSLIGLTLYYTLITGLYRLI